MQRRIMALGFIVLLILMMTGCSQRPTVPDDEQQYPEIRQLIFVTDDVENVFSALAWKQLQSCAASANAQVTLLEVQYQADKASTALNQASGGLYDVVILDRLSGESATEWVRRNAGYYPDVQYLCLDTVPDDLPELGNVTWLVWDSAPVYYLYGALAAINSTTGTVAFLGKETGVRSEHAFLSFYAGISQVSSQCRALYYVSNQMTGEQGLQTMINAAMAEQADVFCSWLGVDSQRLMQIIGNQEQPALLLVGDAAQMEGELMEYPWVLSAFWFETEDILKTVFAQCCSDTLKPGVRLLNWDDGIELMRADSFPGTEDPELLALCRRIELEARNGALEQVLTLISDAEERQQMITAAGENKEITK